MTETIRNLDPIEEARLMSHVMTLRAALKNTVELGEPPYRIEQLDRAWDAVVQYPIAEDEERWIVFAFAAVLGNQLQALYGFRWGELEDEYGVSPCMVESRTQVQVFPMDTIGRKLEAGERKSFRAYFEQVREAMEGQGLQPAFSQQ